VKVTVLDDYQRAFDGTEAIQRLRQRADVQILTEKLPTEAALARALKGVKAIIPIRERTKFPAALLQALPDLEFISQTGNHAHHVDMEAATKAGSSGKASGKQHDELVFIMFVPCVNPTERSAMRRANGPCSRLRPSERLGS
jgi:phosphoglycerate dehydrogenase-like enzyme